MTRKKVLLLHPQTFHRSIVRIEVLGVPCNMTSKFWRRQTGGRKRLLTDYRREDPSIKVLVAKPTQARNTRRKSAMVIGKHTCRSSYFCDTARHGPHMVTSSTEILMLSIWCCRRLWCYHQCAQRRCGAKFLQLLQHAIESLPYLAIMQ